MIEAKDADPAWSFSVSMPLQATARSLKFFKNQWDTNSKNPIESVIGMCPTCYFPPRSSPGAFCSRIMPLCRGGHTIRAHRRNVDARGLKKKHEAILAAA